MLFCCSSYFSLVQLLLTRDQLPRTLVDGEDMVGVGQHPGEDSRPLVGGDQLLVEDVHPLVGGDHPLEGADQHLVEEDQLLGEDDHPPVGEVPVEDRSANFSSNCLLCIYIYMYVCVCVFA